MRNSQTSRSGRRGQAALLVTLSLIPMIGVVSLATDVGYLYYLKNVAQAAADSAALAAVYRTRSTITGSSFSCTSYPWMCHTDPWPCPAGLTSGANPAETACVYAKQNGFDTADPKKTVTIVSDVTSTTTTTAPGVNGMSYWITVRVTQSVPLLFAAVIGNKDGLVSARATAAFHPGLGCVYALDPTASASFYMNGSTTFRSACGLYVNSDASDAMLGVGGATLQTSENNVVGGVDWGGTINPTPNTGMSPVLDPLSNLAAPAPCASAGGCQAADCSVHPNQVTINSDTTLLPGTYCGGIAVKKGLATFSAGTYIIVGGGISTQNSNSHIAGTGVYIYNTYNSSNSYSPIDFNANSDVQLGTATSGDYTGILYMQDRTCCASTVPTESFQGGASSFFEGVVYAPRSLIQFRGNPVLSMADFTIVIARRFELKGNSTVNNDYSHPVGGNPIKQVGPAEDFCRG